MLKVLVAPTAYKGTLSPAEAAAAIAGGVREAFSEADIVLAPVADGGDGTVESLHMALGGQVNELVVEGPVGQPVKAAWLRIDGLGVVELASASGLALVPSGMLSPLSAHTRGTGEVIAHCLTGGVSEVVAAVGGSASTDGGTGALCALGARFLDSNGADLPPGGGELIRIDRCDLSGLGGFSGLARIRVATDVTNPLLGKEGAARIFAPQKGASPEQVELLETALERFADVLEESCGKRARHLPGAGAAGGTAFGFSCALGADIIPGFRWLAALTQLESKIEQSDLVITGEGRLDHQSLSGKVIGELATLCRRHGKTLLAVPALAEDNVDWQTFGIAAVVPLSQGGQQLGKDEIRQAIARLIVPFLS